MFGFHARPTALPFQHAVAVTAEALTRHGSGVLSDIDVQATRRKKIGKEIRPCRILGARNPTIADRALEAEPLIGTMLPCNIAVRDRDGGAVEIAAVNPVASMQAVGNPALAQIAGQVRDLLRGTVDEAAG